MTRLRVAVALALIAGSLAWVAGKALSGNLVYYSTTSELIGKGSSAIGQRLRLGGYVEPGSVRKDGSTVRFIVSDRATRLTVIDTAGVPSLFRAGKGVIVEGTLGRDGAFHADTVLVRHSDSYRPPVAGRTPHSAELQPGG